MDDYKKDQGFSSVVEKIQERRRFSKSDKDIKRDSSHLFREMSKKMLLKEEQEAQRKKMVAIASRNRSPAEKTDEEQRKEEEREKEKEKEKEK